VIYLGSSLSVFAAMWLLHVAWFRISPPRTRVQALLMLFGAGLAALAIGLMLAAPYMGGATPMPATALALYVLMSFAYVIIYTAIEVDSPSALIALLVHERGTRGMTLAELRELLTDDNLVMARLRDLVAVGSVKATGNEFRLESRGLLIARVFAAYRALLGRGLGG
jgi:hypothetical protein